MVPKFTEDFVLQYPFTGGSFSLTLRPTLDEKEVRHVSEKLLYN